MVSAIIGRVEPCKTVYKTKTDNRVLGNGKAKFYTVLCLITKQQILRRYNETKRTK